MPSYESSSNSRNYCDCEREARQTPARLQPLLEPGHLTSCSHHDNIRLPVVIPSLDVTAEYIGSAHLVRGAGKRQAVRRSQGGWASGGSVHLAPGAPSQAPGEGPPPRSRRRRQDYTFVSNFPFQSLSQTDIEGFAYFFPEDHVVDDQSDPSAPPTWPTESGLTRGHALQLCRHAVANSSVGAGCGRLLGEVLGSVVDMCLADLQLKDDLAWLGGTLPLLENECERRLVRDGERSRHQDILSFLKCPGLCSGNGQCSEWGCVCFPGFGSYDCSALSGKCPWKDSVCIPHTLALGWGWVGFQNLVPLWHWFSYDRVAVQILVPYFGATLKC